MVMHCALIPSFSNDLSFQLFIFLFFSCQFFSSVPTGIAMKLTRLLRKKTGACILLRDGLNWSLQKFYDKTPVQAPITEFVEPKILEFVNNPKHR
jgi:hypothetical protein